MVDAFTVVFEGSRSAPKHFERKPVKTMTREARMMTGIILITVPTIQYGGYFLLTSLINKGSGYMDNALRQNFFRAGHAHAGVIVILSLVCQMLADGAALPDPLLCLFESEGRSRQFSFLRGSFSLYCPDRYSTQ
jgi:hypothetical protein